MDTYIYSFAYTYIYKYIYIINNKSIKMRYFWLPRPDSDCGKHTYLSIRKVGLGRGGAVAGCGVVVSHRGHRFSGYGAGGGVAELQILFLPEARVQRPRLSYEVGVSALFADLAVLQHEDQVGVDDGGEPMSYHHRGAVTRYVAQGIQDLL